MEGKNDRLKGETHRLGSRRPVPPLARIDWELLSISTQLFPTTIESGRSKSSWKIVFPIEIVNVAILESAMPSLTFHVNCSDPMKPGSGVYTMSLLDRFSELLSPW